MTAPTLILLLIITIMFTIIIIDLKTHIENEYALVQTQNDCKQVRPLPLIEFHFMQIIRKLNISARKRLQTGQGGSFDGIALTWLLVERRGGDLWSCFGLLFEVTAPALHCESAAKLKKLNSKCLFYHLKSDQKCKQNWQNALGSRKKTDILRPGWT